MNTWNERYSKEEYHYGKIPNEFLKQELKNYKPGSILFLGEGEGRNAVYAATLGWNVDAVDSSEAGKVKAVNLANEKNVAINYYIEDVFEFNSNKLYDAVALIYLHVNDEQKKILHKKALSLLKPSGVLFLEAFEKDQVNYNSGGPKDPELLYDLKNIAEDFIDLEFEKLSKDITTLEEGSGHKGQAVLVRFVGINKI